MQKGTEQVCGVASAKEPLILNVLKKASSCRKHFSLSKYLWIPAEVPNRWKRTAQTGVRCPGQLAGQEAHQAQMTGLWLR